MNRNATLLRAVVPILVALCAAGAAGAQEKLRVADPVVSSLPATLDERAALLEQFVAKWSDYATKTYSTDVAAWRRQLAPVFEGGDETNLRRAVTRGTFESAIATLMGKGHEMSDADVKGVAALAPAGGEGPSLKAMLLGALSNDLVYTPIAPCRILDTRLAGGPIAGGFTRSFKAFNSANYTAQGGSATNCGTLGIAATAVAINLTAVNPSAGGFATVFPFGTTQPTVASINYATSTVVNNGLIVQIPNPASTSDFTLFTLATANYVADIVGFFAPPTATALDCATVSGTPTNVAAGAYVSLPTVFCAATYTPVGLSISAGENVVVADSYTAGNAGQVFVRSLSANAQNVTPKLMCCRVPGR